MLKNNCLPSLLHYRIGLKYSTKCLLICHFKKIQSRLLANQNARYILTSSSDITNTIDCTCWAVILVMVTLLVNTSSQKNNYKCRTQSFTEELSDVQYKVSWRTSIVLELSYRAVFIECRKAKCN